MSKKKRTAQPIILRKGRTPQAVDSAERILIANVGRLLVFHRGGEVIRVITVRDMTRSGRLSRPSGTVMLHHITPPAMVELFEREAGWFKLDKNDHRYQVDCPLRVATSYLSRAGQWRVPELRGFIEAPLVLPHGEIVMCGGYDATTRLYLTDDWPEAMGRSNLQDAQAALKRLLEPFQEFPFVGREDKAVLVAGILTALQRRILPSAPLFAFTAPAARTGKSLLAESIAIIATGREAPAMAVAAEHDEIRKAVLACLREGHLIVNLDNIEEPLTSPDLCRAITQPVYSDRVLGESRVLRLPTNVLWTATGNNLTVRGDLAVRTLLCRLDSRVERPESRKFGIADLKNWLIEHRRELVAAAIKILRAYELARRPDMGLEPWGGFDEWSASVRSAVVWAGMTDPCKTRQYVLEDDPEREEAAELLFAWRDRLGDTPTTLANLILESGPDQKLKDALDAVCGKQNGHDSKKLAWWCRRWNGRVLCGLRLTKSGSSGHATMWAVLAVGGSSGGVTGVSGDISSPTKNENFNFELAENDSSDSTDSKPEPQPPSAELLPREGSHDPVLEPSVPYIRARSNHGSPKTARSRSCNRLRTGHEVPLSDADPKRGVKTRKRDWLREARRGNETR